MKAEIREVLIAMLEVCENGIVRSSTESGRAWFIEQAEKLRNRIKESEAI